MMKPALFLMHQGLLFQLVVLLIAATALTVPFADEAACSVEKEVYADCAFRLDPPSLGRSCDNCRIETIKTLDETGLDCSEYEDGLCTALTDTCAPLCGDCIDELEAFWHCTTQELYNGTCTIDCGTRDASEESFRLPSTTDELELEPLCPKEFDTYEFCVTGEFLQDGKGKACDECRLGASAQIPSDVTDCAVVQDIFCRAVASCSCGVCAGPMESYLNCDVYKRWFGDCSLDCGVVDGDSSSAVTDGVSGATKLNSSLLRIVAGSMLVRFVFGGVL